MLYRTPAEFYFPLHHVRPRFKDDIEGVLLYFADSVVQLGSCDADIFNRQMNAKLRDYPGNATRSEKTMSNWRTEISTLFSFVQHVGDREGPSRRCKELSQGRDLPEAFRKFLYTFQYPGGHLKPNYVAELIHAGIKFKPVQTILRLFKAGNKGGGNTFCLSKAEVCHCVFNDLRVTRDHEDASDTLQRVLVNRRNRNTYNEDGDTIRYAGDILDYMTIAGLLKTHDGRNFYINTASSALILKFIASDEWFDGYGNLYGKSEMPLSAVAGKQGEWEDFVNCELPDSAFAIDIDKLLGGESEASQIMKKLGELYGSFESSDQRRTTGATTGDIGERGEALVYGHECMRLKADGREDLIHLVKRIPTSLALGFDISSVESDAEQKRYIEVKSTASFKPILFNSVHLTPNEWRVAETERDRYFVYRLFVSIETGEVKLYLLQDPVGKYKADEITMMPSSSGSKRLSGTLSLNQYAMP